MFSYQKRLQYPINIKLLFKKISVLLLKQIRASVKPLQAFTEARFFYGTLFMDLFDKPYEQSETCFDFAMARKGARKRRI